MTTQEIDHDQQEKARMLWDGLRFETHRVRSDRDRYQAVRKILEGIEFTTTITAIRELVNDPKWDDKV